MGQSYVSYIRSFIILQAVTLIQIFTYNVNTTNILIFAVTAKIAKMQLPKRLVMIEIRKKYICKAAIKKIFVQICD